ncbi:hypothetical protein LTR02_017642 [Friedmanniomyces endolithicus]|nr:hypothetical protein LTR02_017642 [Friedmanniomyces endolithicus]
MNVNSGGARAKMAPVTRKRRVAPAQADVDAACGEAETEEAHTTLGSRAVRPNPPRLHASSYSTTSSKRSRTSSPTKSSAAPRSLDKPIGTGDLVVQMDTLPEDMQQLMRAVKECADGFETVPEDCKKPSSKHPNPPSAAETRSSTALKPTVLSLGRAPTLDLGDRVSTRARECRATQEYEAAWNSLVHGPLLDYAQHTSRHHLRVDVANVTTAQLSVRLKPRFPNSLRPVQGKMVDFAVVLKRTPTTDRGYDSSSCEGGTPT